MNAPARHGIRTRYAGIDFRSRHEAIWAATFNKLGLKWTYEPTDLDGYIPDFDLLFKRKPLLVEIKPAEEDFELAKSKIECSGWDGDAAILVSGEHDPIGIFYEDGFGWDNCAVAACMACKKPTLMAEGGRWCCRSCGAGNRELWFAYDIRRQWREAQNELQWRPRV